MFTARGWGCGSARGDELLPTPRGRVSKKPLTVVGLSVQEHMVGGCWGASRWETAVLDDGYHGGAAGLDGVGQGWSSRWGAAAFYGV